MVACFYQSQEKMFRPRYEAVYSTGLPILKVTLPPKYSLRRLKRMAAGLYGKGIRRFLTDDPSLDLRPLRSVSPLPLYRAKGAELVLTLVEEIPFRKRRVALRGEKVGSEAWRLAEALCPQVGGLLLDFDRGEEDLSCHLRTRFGAAPLHLGQGQSPQAAVELEPRPSLTPRTLRLWGKPELQGLTLFSQEPLPPGFPALPLLELYWETGRVALDHIRVARGEEWP